MRARAVAVVAASALVLLAAPSSAAPERDVTLTPAQRSASWVSDFRIGPYFGIGCDREALGCETTLIRLTRAGALNVTTTQRVPTDAVDGQLILDLFRSDGQGVAHRRLDVKERRSGGTVSISASSLPAGYYLVEVKWYELTYGDYRGTASFVPR